MSSVAFSPDGKLVAASSVDGTARVWRVGETDPYLVTPKRGLAGEVFKIGQVAFSADSARAVTAGPITTVWDLATKQPIAELPRVQTQIVEVASFSPDGNDLILGGQDGVVTRWDAHSYRFVENVIKAPAGLTAMAYCGGSDRIAIADKAGTAFLWNIARDNAIAVLGDRTRPAVAVAFSPDGKTIFAGLGVRQDRHPVIDVWDLFTRKLTSTVALPADPWALSAGGATVHAETRSGELVTWSPLNGEAATTPVVHGLDHT